MDVPNKFVVGSSGDRIRILRLQADMTPDEALNLAAWLVALADGQGKDKFEEVLAAVQNT